MFHSRAFCKVGKSLQFTESAPEISLVCGVPVSVTEKTKILTWLKDQPHTHTLAAPKVLASAVANGTPMPWMGNPEGVQ